MKQVIFIEGKIEFVPMVKKQDPECSKCLWKTSKTWFTTLKCRAGKTQSIGKTICDKFEKEER